jgi:hypothetical protein
MANPRQRIAEDASRVTQMLSERLDLLSAKFKLNGLQRDLYCCPAPTQWKIDPFSIFDSTKRPFPRKTRETFNTIEPISMRTIGKIRNHSGRQSQTAVLRSVSDVAVSHDRRGLAVHVAF